MSEVQAEAGVEKRGQLKLFEGHVFLGWAPLLVRVGNTARVSVEARSQLKLSAQDHFDEVLFELRRDGVKIVYDNNFGKSFNFSTRYEEFTKLDAAEQAAFNSENALGLSTEEVTNETTFVEAQRLHEELKKSALKKFQARFGLPTLPGAPSIGDIDLGVFGNDANNALHWLSEPGSEARGGLARRASNEPAKLNLLRLHSSTRSVQSLTGHALTLASARKIFKRLSSFYAGDSRYENSNFEAGGHTVRALTEYAQVGCQSVPRSEVLRFGKMMGWDQEESIAP